MRVQCPKCAHVPYCLFNPIENGVYILVEVSFHICARQNKRILADDVLNRIMTHHIRRPGISTCTSCLSGCLRSPCMVFLF